VNDGEKMECVTVGEMVPLGVGLGENSEGVMDAVIVTVLVTVGEGEKGDGELLGVRVPEMVVLGEKSDGVMDGL
jgi:hypothetical protein